MQGQADDNGKAYAISVERGASEYRGTVNDKSRTLPLEAFPNTLWHYGIVDHRLLFKQTDLDLLRVNVVEAKETIKIAMARASPPSDRRSAATSGRWSGSTSTTISCTASIG
jgi:hypothetical protein